MTPIDMTAPWRLQAACRTIPDGFYPPSDGGPQQPHHWADVWYQNEGVQGGRTGGYITARPICAGCPVQTECLTDAFNTEGTDHHGMRGGLSARQRDDLRLANKRKAA